MPDHAEFVNAIDSLLDECSEYGKGNISNKLRERYPNWHFGDKRVAKHLKSLKNARKSSGTINEGDITVPKERDSADNQEEEDYLNKSNTCEDDGIFRVNNASEAQSDNVASIRKEESFSSDSKVERFDAKDTETQSQSSRTNDDALESALFGEISVTQTNEPEEVPQLVTLEDMNFDSPEQVETENDAPVQVVQQKENGHANQKCSQLIKVTSNNAILVIEDLMTQPSQEISAESGDTDSIASEESEPDTKTGILTEDVNNGKSSKEASFEKGQSESPVVESPDQNFIVNVEKEHVVETKQTSPKSEEVHAVKIVTDEVFEGALTKDEMAEKLSQSKTAMPKTPSKGVEMYEDSRVTAKPKKNASKSVRDREAEVDTICRCQIM
ncbi:unnamed protein product [Albugo candida]|nr:unnamed protein product [Albugo candida]|eukprot:CCI43297.1 unnamed protein product [Albugo candida]